MSTSILGALCLASNLRKFLFVSVLGMTISGNSFGGQVDSLTAKTVAEKYFIPKLQKLTKLKSATANYALKQTKTGYVDHKPSYYIFNAGSEKGFVIVAADDAVNPILGYSYEGNYNDNEKRPEAFDSLIANYNRQIQYLRKAGQKASAQTQKAWGNLSDANTVQAQTYSTTAEVLPLMQTKWNQGCGYNALSPVDAAGPCGRTWAGCVAVSMAQVLKYWNSPATGEGSKTYTHYKYGAQTADFASTTYNWAGMTNTSANAEVAKLLYHLGVSVTMDFGPSGSGAYFANVQSAIRDHFKYTSNAILASKYSYTEANWVMLLKRELNEGRPLMYAGGTHAYVIDGYQANDYFHLNWGWGGSYDGYFLINNLKPGSYDFTSSQSAVIGVVPKTLEPVIDLADITELTCGVAKIDSTTNGTNKINRYKNSYYQTTGKEKIYSITTTTAGKIKATLSGLKGKQLILSMLSYPHRDSLIKMGDTTITLYPAKAGKYYFSVDGWYGAEGSYQLQVNCPDTRPDLSIKSAKISPYMIESGQANVALECWVKNMGNTATAANKAILFYSDDELFDVADSKLDSMNIPALNPGDSVKLNQTVTMPAFAEGTHYVAFSIDPYNTINESDETDNTLLSMFYGLPPSIMDCSAAVALQSGTWYTGNTTTQGNANISSYGEVRGYSGKEVIHTLTANYKGIATVTFSKKASGLSCIILSACNENRFAGMVYGEGSKDTASVMDFEVEKNTTYYFVVDGMQGSSGEYWLKVIMPDLCPKPIIKTYGDTVFCAGSNAPMLSATYGYKDYQWYKNGFAVVDANIQSHYPAESGKYQVEVNENGCTARSNGINITVNSTPKPTIALLGVDSLKADVLATSYEWYFNSVKNSLTTRVIKPAENGSYKVLAIDKGCRSELSDAFSFSLTEVDFANAETISIAPNPSQGLFKIKTTVPSTETCNIEIYSPVGVKLLTHTNVDLNNFVVDLTAYTEGIYIIKITLGKQVYTNRLVKK